jgi:hypothetical protein
METVEIREHTQYGAYCTVCLRDVGERRDIWREANADAGAHEHDEHPDPTEDA